MRISHRLASLALILIAGIATLGFTVFSPTAQAQSTGGAAVISLDNPIVSYNATGATVQANGSVASGLAACTGGPVCTGGLGGGSTPICNCCNIPPVECPEVSWHSCLVTAVNYTITGPSAKSGSATVTSTSQSPSGCTTSCSKASEGGAPQCQENKGFSFTTAGYTPGTYTLTVTTTDCKGTNSVSKNFTITAPLVCSPATQTVNVDQNATIHASGGSGAGYTWTYWKGSNKLTATGAVLTTSWGQAWTNTIELRDSVGNLTTCQVKVQDASTNPGEAPPTGQHSLNASSCHVYGFAYDPDTQSTPVAVEARIAGGATISGTANKANTNINGTAITCPVAANCGFDINLSGIVPLGQTKSISVYAKDTANGQPYILNASPKDILCTTELSCTPSTQSVAINTNATTTASGGTNAYAWSGGGTPSTGSSANFLTQYSTAGVKTVTVTSGGQTKSCSINVSNTLACSAANPTIANGGTASFTAVNGTGPYTWTSSNGIPSSGSGETYNPAYTQSGTQTATVTSGGKSAQCSVSVGAADPLAPGVSLYIQDPSNGFYNLETLTIPYNTSVGLRWSSSHASSCDGPTGPGGDTTGSTYNPSRHTSGTVATNAHTKSFTYFTTCYNGSVSVSDYATVNVQPECLPAGQTITTGQSATLTARGGNGTYSWAASGGSPSAANGASITTTYNASGTKNVILSSGGMTSTCTVTVQDIAAPACTGTVQVVSNVPTTWTLTGPTNQTQSTPSSNVSYASMPCGNYILGSVPNLAGAGTPTINPAVAQAVTASSVTIFSINYPSSSAGVDIKANGSNTPAPIVAGDKASLTWTSSNVATGTCSASSAPSGWSGSKPDSNTTGEQSQTLNANTTFTLTCKSSIDGTNISDSVLVRTRIKACGDGIDNDGDTRVDSADPGCGGGGGFGDDDDEGNAWNQCEDGVDNSDPEDTLADTNDPGCHSDGDVRNASSYTPSDNDEQNAGVVIGACNDGLDNDGDGRIDSTDDGCASPTDTSELKEPDIHEI